MVRSDIFGALRNAIERGDSLDDAKISLTNAGYSKEEVEEAAGAMITEGSEEKLPIIKEVNIQTSVPTIFAPSPSQKENPFSGIMETIKKDKLAIILGGVFLLLVIGLIVTFLLMK